MRRLPRVSLVLLQVCGLALGMSLGASAPGAVDGQAQTGLAQRSAWARGDLSVQHPGVRFWGPEGHTTHIFGTTMTSAPTARQAAELFLDRHRAAFGAGQVTLELTSEDELDQGRMSLFNYVQRIDGLPVELSVLRVLVLNPNGHVLAPTVVLASAKLAAVGERGLTALRVGADEALKSVQQMPAYSRLPGWSKPELVVYFGEGDPSGWIEPVRVWRFEGENPVPKWAQKWTFFVDASTGALVHARNEIVHGPAQGAVRANITPGMLPDTPTNPPQPALIPFIRVNASTGGSAFTNILGAFNFAALPDGDVTLSTSPADAQFFTLTETGGTAISSSTLVTTVPDSPVTGDLLLNPTPGEVSTAQMNAFFHANLARSFIRDRAPTFAALDTTSGGIRLAINTSVSGSCNAFYNGTSINFYRAAGTCVNTAFSDVVSHEFGHHVVNRRGLAQGGFGEGYGDSLGIWLHDIGIIGNGFRGPGTFVRRPDIANQQYPCTSTAVHTCGQILGGVMYEYKELLKAAYGTDAGLALGRQQFVNWTLVTTGGIGTSTLNSAHPGTAVDLLTIDDVDGNIGNGTPNYARICDAMSMHGIACPALSLISITFPNGLPALVPPSTPTSISVSIVGVNGSPVAGTETLVYRAAGTGAAFSEAVLTPNGGGLFTATLPASACRTRLEYYVRVNDAGGSVVTSPSTAPTALYSTSVGAGNSVVATDTFETDNGWTAQTGLGDTATTGRFVRMAPQQTVNGSAIAQPGADATPDPGTLCWVTDGNAGTSVGANDVDGGFTTLLSPALNLEGMSDATISYKRWFFGSATDDSMTVEISADGSTNWQLVERVLGTGASGAWVPRDFAVGQFITPTNATRLRVRVTDVGTGTIVEGAFDDFEVRRISCPVNCSADYTGDGLATVQDVFEFLALWFGNCTGGPDAPCNGRSADRTSDGMISNQDLFDFLTAWFTGC